DEGYPPIAPSRRIEAIRNRVDFYLVHRLGFDDRRLIQRLFGRWCRLHPNALFGLPARHSDARCRRDRSLRNYHFRRIRSRETRNERERRYPVYWGDAAWRAHRRKNRSQSHPVL